MTDGKIAGTVKAADLRTPVTGVQLRFASDHVDQNVLDDLAAGNTGTTSTGEPYIFVTTGDDGTYALEGLPLGSYTVSAHKQEGDLVHEFESGTQSIELTLNGPKVNGLDFVDISVFPVSGQIYYSIEKPDGSNLLKVPVDNVVIEAQAIGTRNSIKSEPSILLPAGSNNTNYSLPLFAGKYMFLAHREGHTVRVDRNTPGYEEIDTGNPDAGGTIEVKKDKTIDFIDSTARQLTIIVEDSGGFPLNVDTANNAIHPDEGADPNTGLAIEWEAEVEGPGGVRLDDGSVVSDVTIGVLNDGRTGFVATVNPGKYTIRIQGAKPKNDKGEPTIVAEVDLTGGDGEVTMVIPVQIELRVISTPPTLLGADVMENEEFKTFLCAV